MSEVNGILVSSWSWLERITDSFWTGLTWPHAVLIIFIIAVACYRREFKALIERISEIGPVGFTLQPPIIETVQSGNIETPGPQKQPSSARLNTTPAAKIEGNPIPLPPIVFPEQMRIAKELIGSEIAGMSDDEAKEYLIPMLAISRSLWVFENCYACIFGGQIRLLQMLNQQPGRSMSILGVNSYWLHHQAQVKPILDLWTSEQYLQYLTNNGLIARSIDSIQLTVKGAEFLLWLVNYSRPVDRPW
ncbi:hypothetical protein HX871_18855 [Pseudomonas reactans]|uniref:Uncharacterized protein n=1 Tax=Pseudomonas reactans TaxID=117680 RepID=A0ABX2R089_9PSED|nr:hypothetical protein [Pseudomonas reactans]NWA41108.1 hypothetical protein [Pseudomonas reactans]NWD96486.1 hypothetical protein [Pseudomonas reactans]NWF14644.1 hypothetical protein [Pseudomonas reactans]